MRDVILHGDCLALLKTLEENSVDSLVCDPPAGISFMGKEWDNPNYFPTRQRPADHKQNFGHSMTSGPEWSYNKKARDTFIAFLTEVMAECLRVVRPGGHALVWALPRTSHWTATALEDAGWQIRDVITHTFGSGFPKSHDISKAIDRLAGAEREVVGHYPASRGGGVALGHEGYHRPWMDKEDARERIHTITAPATPEAQRWSGYGSALKPASEHWILARKPLAAANLASNVLEWGTGGLAIDKCRVATSEDRSRPPWRSAANTYDLSSRLQPSISNDQGRWPPNFLLSHADACTPLACADECAVRLLDEQAGERKSGMMAAGTKRNTTGGYHGNMPRIISADTYGDSGMVSRFFPVFYAAKASRRERNEGCEALPERLAERHGARSQGPLPQQTPQDEKPESNHHPTVKSLALMRWLVRLVTPPGGTVLDCFAGSGSTLVACVQEGFHYIGMEQDEAYIKIARARAAAAHPEQEKPKRAKITRLPKRSATAEQLVLFA